MLYSWKLYSDVFLKLCNYGRTPSNSSYHCIHLQVSLEQPGHELFSMHFSKFHVGFCAISAVQFILICLERFDFIVSRSQNPLEWE